MLYAKNNGIFTLCQAVKYVHKQDSFADFSSQPRPCHNLAFFLEGYGLVEANGKIIRVEKGDILFIPKNSTYKAWWKVKDKAIFHSIHFNFDSKNDPFADLEIPVQNFRLDNFQTLYNLLEEFQNTQYSKNEHSFIAISAVYRILGELVPHIVFEKARHFDSVILPAVKYIESNYKEKISIEKLADLCFLSPSRFFYLFKEHMYKSPIVYKNELCISSAAQTLLLFPDKSIEEISEEFGFESSIYFRRLFKKIMKKTPMQYRKEGTLL